MTATEVRADSLLAVTRDTLEALDALARALPSPARITAVKKQDARSMFYLGTLSGITSMLGVARDQLLKLQAELAEGEARP